MDELLAEMDRCLRDIYERQEDTNISTMVEDLNPSSYQSCIRIHGKPLLPPLMTHAKRIEMKKYKEAAMRKESELESKRIQKSTILDSSYQQVSDCQTSPYATCSDNSELDERPETDGLVAGKAMTTTDEIFMDASVDLPDNSHGRFVTTGGDSQEAIKKVTEDKNIETFLLDGKPSVLMDSLPSTASSSDVSAFNQTVINLSDLNEQGKAEAVVDGRDGMAADHNRGESDKETENVETTQACGSVNSSQSDPEEEDEGTRDPQLLQRSFSDTESFISFIGEYNKLPTPTPSSSTPEVSDVVGSVLDGDVATTFTPTNPDRFLPAKGMITKGGPSVDGTPEHSPGTLDHSPGGLSTMDTNVSSLGSLGQSCTLPISVTESCDSTLADISERLDTPSITDDILMNKADPVFSSEPGGGRDFSGSGTDSSVPSTVRRGPVGQEAEGVDDDKTNRYTDTLTSKDEEGSSTSGDGKQRSSEEMYSSPMRRVRRNSYTLDVTSPALLAAKERNEAPEATFAASLDNKQEISGDIEGKRKGDEQDEAYSTGENNDKLNTEGDIAEVALVSQLELLEEIKRRLAAEQKEQLEELLKRQKREQWLLQKEMMVVERQVTESRASRVSERNPQSRLEDVPGHGMMVPPGITTDDSVTMGHLSDHESRNNTNSDVMGEGGSLQIGSGSSSTLPGRNENLGGPSSEIPGWFSSNGYKGSATTSVQDSLEREQFQDRSEFGVASVVKQDYDEDNTWIPSLQNEEHTEIQNKMRQLSSDLHQDNKSVQARGEDDERPSAYFNETKKPEVSGTVKVTGRGGGGASGFYLEYGQHERTEEMREGGRRQEMQYSTKNLDRNFDLISAATKGFLTRRLMATVRVQEIVKTIKDSTAFLFKLQTETPIKGGNISTQDAALAQRILNQLRAAKFELHDIFHSLTPSSRIIIIQQDRQTTEQLTNRKSLAEDDMPSRPLSAATVKAIERRKKAKEIEKRVFGSQLGTKGQKSDSQARPKSAPYSRILKQLQGHEAPSFPTRPVSSAAYRSKRTIDVSRSTSTNNKLNVKVDGEQRPRRTTTSVQRSKPQNSVRRVLYPTTSSSAKQKITRKQAPKKPFKP